VSGGRVSFEHINSGGVQLTPGGFDSEVAVEDQIFAGGGVIVSAGGGGAVSGIFWPPVFFLGGHRPGTVIERGGTQIVSSGGSTIALLEGGLEVVRGGGDAYVAFDSSGGRLEADGTGALSVSVAGFASLIGVFEAIDFASVGFIPGVTKVSF